MSTHGREMRAFLVVCLSLSLCGGPAPAAQPIQQAAVTPRQPATVGRLVPRPVGISHSAGQTPAVPRMSVAPLEPGPAMTPRFAPCSSVENEPARPA